LADFGYAHYERQWCQSIRSLRRHNASIEVHLVHYGSVPRGIVREAERQRVAVHRPGGYRDCLEAVFPEHADALSHCPTFHKILSLRFIPVGHAAQVLYLDCDTFFFCDVARIFQNHQTRHFFAREEPWSRRSHYGYRPGHIDEDLLVRTCAAEKLAFIPPYNSGVMLFNHGVWSTVGALAERSLSYGWRLLAGVCEDEQLARECSLALREQVALSFRRSPEPPPLRYPSSNWWIVDAIATWLTLGAVRGLTHDVFRRADVVQGGEYNDIEPESPPVLVHYFSNLESEFFASKSRLSSLFFQGFRTSRGDGPS
jgi:hypothetical protein